MKNQDYPNHKTDSEIESKLSACQAAESELVDKIEEQLIASKIKMTDAIAAQIDFFNLQKKLLSAKIEAYKWVLGLD